MSDNDTNSMLDAAAAKNISLVVAGPLGDYPWMERFYLEAGKSHMYFGTVNGDLSSSADPNSDQPANDPAYYDRYSLQATVPNAYMVSDYKYSATDPWITDSVPYQVYYRLKVQRSGSPAPSTPVARLEVYDLSTSSLVISRDLLSSDFPTDNTYYTFEVDFDAPHPSSSVPNPPTVSSI